MVVGEIIVSIKTHERQNKKFKKIPKIFVVLLFSCYVISNSLIYIYLYQSIIQFDRIVSNFPTAAFNMKSSWRCSGSVSSCKHTAKNNRQ